MLVFVEKGNLSEQGKHPDQGQPTYGTRPEWNLGHIHGWWPILTTVPSVLPNELALLAYNYCQDLAIVVPANQLNFDLFRRKKLLRELMLSKNPKVTNSLLTFYWQIRYDEVCKQA